MGLGISGTEFFCFTDCQSGRECVDVSVYLGIAL